MPRQQRTSTLWRRGQQQSLLARSACGNGVDFHNTRCHHWMCAWVGITLLPWLGKDVVVQILSKFGDMIFCWQFFHSKTNDAWKTIAPACGCRYWKSVAKECAGLRCELKYSRSTYSSSLYWMSKTTDYVVKSKCKMNRNLWWSVDGLELFCAERI